MGLADTAFIPPGCGVDRESGASRTLFIAGRIVPPVRSITVRTTFYILFILSACVTVATVILGTRALSRHAASGSPNLGVPVDGEFGTAHEFEPPEVRPLPSAEASRPLPAPTVSDPRPARPRMDAVIWQAGNRPRFDRVLKQFYPGELDPPDARLSLNISVASDGRIVDATTRDSTFGNAGFEAALIDEAKRTKYPEDDRYRTTGFSIEIRSAKPLPQRPLSEIDAAREVLLARIMVRRQAIFADKPVPTGAQLKVVYRVSPDGAVDQAKLESSTYRSSAFGRAVVDEIRKQRFKPEKGYAPSQFAFEYSDASAKKGSGQAGLQSGR